MKAQPRATVPVERRKQLLHRIPGFAALPDTLIADLAAGMKEEHFAAGDIVVAEGQVGDRLFLIEEGQAEVVTSGAMTPVRLANLDRDDMFGEIALLSSSRRRQATVTALKPLWTVSLSAAAFEKALAAAPEVRLDIATIAETLLTAKFLKQQGSWRR